MLAVLRYIGEIGKYGLYIHNERFLQIMGNIWRLKWHLLGKSEINNILIELAKKNRPNAIKLIMGKGANDFNAAFYSACSSGLIDICEMFREKTNYHGFLDGFGIACRHNHMKLINHLYIMGTHILNVDFVNYTLRNGAHGGHINVVKSIQYRIKKNYYDARGFDYDISGAIFQACVHQHFDIIKYLIGECSLDIRFYHIYKAVLLSCEKNFKEFLQLFAQKCYIPNLYSNEIFKYNNKSHQYVEVQTRYFGKRELCGRIRAVAIYKGHPEIVSVMDDYMRNRSSFG